MRQVTPRWVLVVGLAAVGAGCGKRGRVQRDRDASPVVLRDPNQVGSLVVEREPNGEVGVATAMRLGDSATGSIDGASDVDIFAIAVEQAGMVRLSLSGIEGVDLRLELRDSGGNLLATSDRGPANTAEGIPNAGVIPGTYLAVVREFVKAKSGRAGKPGSAKKTVDAPAASQRTGPSPTYSLRTELVTPGVPPAHEREPNDDTSSAGEVVIGDAFNGYVGWGKDADVWKLTLEALTSRNAYDVEVSGVPGLALALEVRDATGVVLLSRRGARGAAISIRGVTPTEDATASAFHLLRISADRSNPEQPYQLMLRGRLLAADDEQEPNDRREQAQALAEASGILHAALASGDVDVYTIAAASTPQHVDVSVRASAGLDARIEVLSPPTPAAGAVGVVVDASGPGDSERLTLRLAAGEGVWFAVSKKAAKADSGMVSDYQLVWNVAPAEPGTEPQTEPGTEPEPDLPLPPEEPGAAQ